MVRWYISRLKAPFGVSARVMLVRGESAKGRVRLGTYGTTGGASDFLVLAYKEGPLAEEGAAYIFEQAILFCTSLGLATCWLGGSFNRRDFKGCAGLQEGERLRLVSPVGYATGKKRFWDVVINADGHHASRKAFESLFFLFDFTRPLTPSGAGVYRRPLELVRIAPSANNFQPWCAVMDDGAVHFYHKKMLGGFDALDMGIALCHFGESCRELGIGGRFEVLSTAPRTKEAVYSVSWLHE
jgi:hypothetical protein